MADEAPFSDLAAAVADALRGDGARLRAAFVDAGRRAEDQAFDAVTPRAENGAGTAPLPRAQRAPLPKPEPDREVILGSANGRRVRARISPAIARRSDLLSLSRASEENGRRAFDALDQHRDAILQLQRAQEAMALNLGALATQNTPAAVTTPAPEQIADATLQAARAQIQNVTNIVNSMQAVAYGQNGRLLAPNNLLLAGTQLFWSLLDPILQRAGVLNAASATVMAAIAPLGSLLTGQILLAERQTPRFISGRATFSGSTMVLQSLRGRVGEHLWPSFQQRSDVPVTITSLDPTVKATRFAAEVVGGTVRIRLLEGAIAPTVGVAWIVDTGADGG